MTLNELLKACKKGYFPIVKLAEIPKGAISSEGQVVCIKDGYKHGGWRGCSVRFPGMKYDVWFSEKGSQPGQRHMNELILA